MPVTATIRSARMSKSPRDVDNVLWRGPAGLKRRVEEAARSIDMSQNAFITSSLLYSTIVFGHIDPAGSPKSLRFLIEEMNTALAADDAVLNAMHRADWEQIEEFVTLLKDGGVINGIKCRRDPKTPETIAFTFHFTREGAAAWRAFGPKLLEAISHLENPIS